ncbi:actin-histidine N-methyltransferase-like [Actinia tenebrosa]|uniref:protein-histidine N-methyltransferase n=1 Tax=Actinia tenebrosa TaxID=6105 RepID=A0A6P8IZ25_ACTTE|nr:actin-histidine N-methyltransferase-like [Actinia tenebrosa]
MGKKGKKKNASAGSENKTSKHNKEVLELCREILDVVVKDFPLLPSAQWGEYLKIYDLIERIMQKQSNECICWDGFSRDDHIDDFMAWFKSNGGVADKVQIHDSNKEGYGLIAVDDIEVRTSHTDILPSVYSTSLYFTPDDLKSLQGTPTLGDALKPYRSIAKQYAYFYKLFQSESKAFKHPFTFDDFRWAVSTVMTRQNQVPISDTENIKALIPMWDMCNHSNGTIETGFDTKDESCKSFAIRPFAKGDQIFIFYGKRNNADLLFHNGFVYPDNEHDFVNIHLGVSRSDRLYAMKAQIMAMVGMDASAHPYPVLRGDDPISPQLRAFLRIFSMDDDELKIRLFNPEKKKILPLSDLPNPDVVISEKNELKSWHYLCMRLNLILSQYKTTIEEDEKELESTEQNINAKNCLLLRITERRILDQALESVSSKLEEAMKKREEKERKEENETLHSIEEKVEKLTVE